MRVFSTLWRNESGEVRVYPTGNDLRIGPPEKLRPGVHVRRPMGGISPDEIAGLQLWLEASPANTGAVEGGTITTWTDLSAAGNDASQATEAKKPTLELVNGVYVVRFDGTDDLMLFAGAIASVTESTILAVTKLRSPAVFGAYKVIFKLEKQPLYATQAGTGDWSTLNGVEVTSGQVISGAFKVITLLSRNFNDVDLVTDGSLVNRTNGTSYGVHTAVIGADAGGTQTADIDLHALLAYDSALSTENREALEARYADTVTELNT